MWGLFSIYCSIAIPAISFSPALIHSTSPTFPLLDDGLIPASVSNGNRDRGFFSSFFTISLRFIR